MDNFINRRQDFTEIVQSFFKHIVLKKQTSLYQAHIALNAKMVDFHGWSMPINYGSQINEHNYVRENLSNDVYRTDDNVYFLLNCNPTYWGEKPPKPTPAVADSVEALE